MHALNRGFGYAGEAKWCFHSAVPACPDMLLSREETIGDGRGENVGLRQNEKMHWCKGVLLACFPSQGDGEIRGQKAKLCNNGVILAGKWK